MFNDASEIIDISSRVRLSLSSSENAVTFDIYLDEPNHEDPKFCYLCGEVLANLISKDVQWYGLYCPFPDETPVIDRLTQLGREYRKCNGNLIFKFGNLAQDVMEFSESSLLYFGLNLFIVASKTNIEDLECPPKFRQFMGNPWKWLSESSAYDFCAMISNDHPGCLGYSPFALSREKIVNELVNSFSSF